MEKEVRRKVISIEDCVKEERKGEERYKIMEKEKLGNGKEKITKTPKQNTSGK